MERSIEGKEIEADNRVTEGLGQQGDGANGHPAKSKTVLSGKKQSLVRSLIIGK